jgi:Uma2 family endonuclease
LCLSKLHTVFTAEQWEKVSQFFAEVGAELPFGLAVPTFVIESRSISQSRAQMLETMQVWMKAGVKEAWLVDPVVISYNQWLNRRNGKRVRAFNVLSTFGQVDVYVRDPATGTYKITTFEKPESVQSVTALPDYFPTS